MSTGLALKLTLALSLATPVPTASQGVGLKLSAADQKLVDKARPYMPGLKSKIDKYWPTMPYPSTLSALIEKESVWNPQAVACVPKPSCSKEYGFGFGQLTITPRFNVFEEVKALHPDLKGWKYEDRFNPDYQMAGLVLKNRLHFRQCEKVMNPGLDAHACGYSSYNGGFGGVLADQRLCGNTSGCDPKVWFGNVEVNSTKGKGALDGYSVSAYSINRTYVRALLIERPAKYTIFPGFEALPPKP